MDFRKPAEIGKKVDYNFEQIKNATGYDHNWCLNTYKNGKGYDKTVCASLYSPKRSFKAKAKQLSRAAEEDIPAPVSYTHLGVVGVDQDSLDSGRAKLDTENGLT